MEPRTTVAMADPLIVDGQPVVRRLASLYSPLVRRSRLGWAAVYHGSNNRAAFTALKLVFGPGVKRTLRARIEACRPDLVISVHPLLNEIAWTVISGVRARPALVTVVTDLVDLHRGWLFPGSDLVVVPTQHAVDACRRRRLPGERVAALGLPVDLRFRPCVAGERSAIRRTLGLDEDRFTILVSGGGEGSGRLLLQVRRLTRPAHPWQVIAVCGRNRALERRLKAVRFATPTRVLGFVDNMPDLMRASDLVVGKAGPGVISEALATGVPMVVTGYLPGQETGNVRYVTGSGFGRYAPTPEALLEEVQELARRESRTYRRLAQNAARAARPRAALDIARECLSLIGAPQRASAQASR